MLRLKSALMIATLGLEAGAAATYEPTLNVCDVGTGFMGDVAHDRGAHRLRRQGVINWRRDQ